MLKATIEIVPFGVEDHPRRRVIGTVSIGLQRVDPGNIGQYISALETDGHHEPPNAVVEVRDHPRDAGAFELIKRALEAHLDPDDPGRLSQAAQTGFLAALAAQNEPEDVKIPDSGSVSIVSPEQEATVEQMTLACPKCGNSETASLLGVEYVLCDPYHYDGVSEWRCQLCGCRWGRWSGRILQDGEAEKPFGRA